MGGGGTGRAAAITAATSPPHVLFSKVFNSLR